MELIRIPRILQDTCKKHLMKGRTIGFVPTMGALHEGHLSLVKRAKMENDIVVASIFVNPTQFGPGEDFEKYPRDTDADAQKLRELEIDTLFLPDHTQMYPPGFSTSLDIGPLGAKLCGHFRPGHFQGVATVVAKLLNIVSPTRAYFGQKDYQQTLVIKRMARDLNFATEIVVTPIIREQDGLAMSSRNQYLNETQRKNAAVLFRALSKAGDLIAAGERSALRVRETMQSMIASEPGISQVDYASVYDPGSLEELPELSGEVLLAVAARLGTVRLIDNLLVNT